MPTIPCIASSPSSAPAGSSFGSSPAASTAAEYLRKRAMRRLLDCNDSTVTIHASMTCDCSFIYLSCSAGLVCGCFNPIHDVQLCV